MDIEMIKDILLVEDDAQDRELTLTGLEDPRLISRVATVSDGEQALDYLYCRGKFLDRAGGHPILVMLDLKMPKVSGLEVLKIIKADQNLKTIPVVVLSSSREKADLVECYRNGVNAFVVKPVDFTELMNAVKQLGLFWTTVNQPMPPTAREETLPEGPPVTSVTPAQHPVPAGGP